MESNMGQWLQVLVYGVPVSEHLDDEGETYDKLYDLTTKNDAEHGEIVLTEDRRSEDATLLGICLTNAYDDTTLKIGPEIVGDEIRATWADLSAKAAEVGVPLGEPAIWLAVVEVA